MRGLLKVRGQLSTETDETLTDRVRAGDDGAFGELYRRHHRAAATTARCLLRSRSDADDVVADAFAGVLSAIRNGRGPRDNFRRYLMACVRNGCRTRTRMIPLAPEDTRFESDRPAERSAMLEDPERYIEADTVARAFSSLTPRWQQMLWSSAVEQKSPREIGLQMDLSPNAVAALNHRAREAFATAYLAEHSAGTPPECSGFAPHLAGYVRGQLPPARFAAVERHVQECASCTRAVDDLRDVNASLRSLGPAPAAAVAMFATPAGGGATTSTSFFHLPYAGTVLKGVAGLLLLAPLVVTGVELFRGGDTSPDESIREVRQAATTTIARDEQPTRDEQPARDEAPAGERDDASRSPAAAPIATIEVGDRPGERPAGAVVTVAVTTAVTAPAAAPGDSRPATGPVVTAVAGTEAPSRPPAPTTAPAPNPSTTVTTEGLLGTLGVDDLVETVGLPELAEAVEAIDTIVLTVTRDVVAPVLDVVVRALPVEVDPGLLPELPGVVLLPETTTAPTTSAPVADPEPNDAAPTPNDDDPTPPAPAGTTPSSTAATTAPPAAGPSPTPAPATTAPPATAPPATPAPTAPPSGGGLLPPISVPPIQLPLLPLPPITLPVITIPGLIG